MLLGAIDTPIAKMRMPATIEIAEMMMPARASPSPDWRDWRIWLRAMNPKIRPSGEHRNAQTSDAMANPFVPCAAPYHG